MRRFDQTLVRCTFTRAGFPHERVFWIEAPGGGYYRGLAYIAYCLQADGRTQITEEEPLAGVKVDGMVVVRVVDRNRPDFVTVEVPGGETCDVATSQLVEDTLDVPVGS
jgi:hypothetical protein